MITGAAVGNAEQSVAGPERSLGLAGSLIKARYQVKAVSSVSRDDVVYTAEEIRYRRPIALKVLRDELAADPEFVAAVRNQACTLAMFTHAHRGVARVYECDATDTGQLFVALEPTRGVTIREVLEARGALDPSAALRVASQIGEALEALHHNRIIHGQLDPDSVLMVRGDNGTEQATLVGVELTAAYRTPIGLRRRDRSSLAYRAPEQIDSGEATEAADVYALGMLLRELLTASRSRETTAGRAPTPALPPVIERILTTALDERPEQRYPDISVMVNDMWGAQTALAEAESPASSTQAILAEAESGARSVHTILAEPEFHPPSVQTIRGQPESRARSVKARVNAHRRSRPGRPHFALRLSAAAVTGCIIAAIVWVVPFDALVSRVRLRVTAPTFTTVPVDQAATPPAVHPLPTEPPRLLPPTSAAREGMSTVPGSHVPKDASTVEGLTYPVVKPRPAAVLPPEHAAAPVVDRPRPLVESRAPAERPAKVDQPGTEAGDGTAIIDWLLNNRR